jgi:hypothetical protein
MNVPPHTFSGKRQCPNYVALDRLPFMVFAPIDVWSSSFAGAVDHAVGSYIIQNFTNFLLVLHRYSCAMDISAVSLEKLLEFASDPAMLAPYEETKWFVSPS